VTQHLENISREALEQFQPVIFEFIRGRRGVYALYRRGKPYYVGLASNLTSRLRTHLRDKHGVSAERRSPYADRETACPGTVGTAAAWAGLPPTSPSLQRALAGMDVKFVGALTALEKLKNESEASDK